MLVVCPHEEPCQVRNRPILSCFFGSCEAEYAAASYTCKEIEFVRNVCADMGVVLQGRLVLGVDNTAAIDVAHNVGVSSKTKHFQRAIHYLRDLTQMRRILPFFVLV